MEHYEEWKQRGRLLVNWDQDIQTTTPLARKR